MKKTYDVVCIGFVVQDIIITNIPFDALSRDTSVADSGIITSGGDAANEAVTLSRLGSRAALLVKIGRDSIGNSIYSTLESEPLDRSLIIRDDTAEMMLAIVAIKPDGERSFLVKPGNDACHLTPQDISDAVLQQTRAVTVGSLFCLPGLDGMGMADILARAGSYGALTLCDMTYDLNQIGPAAMLPVYPHIDYILPSLEEAIYATGETEPHKIADYFLAHGVKNVVIKLGGDGCFFQNQNESFYTDPYCPDVILDTTGCGDTFTGAFTHALLKGWPLRKCTAFACAAGALNATGIGAHHTVESEAQVLTFMENTPRKHLSRY